MKEVLSVHYRMSHSHCVIVTFSSSNILFTSKVKVKVSPMYNSVRWGSDHYRGTYPEPPA